MVSGVGMQRCLLKPKGSNVYVLGPEALATGNRTANSKAVIIICPEIVHGVALGTYKLAVLNPQKTSSLGVACPVSFRMHNTGLWLAQA